MDCLVKTLVEIQNDGADLVGVITDHGHRAGQEHFVIVIIWSGYDKDGWQNIQIFLSKHRLCGAYAEKASESLKNVLERTLGSDVEVFCATADSGGGGSIDNTYPLLQILKVMAMDSKKQIVPFMAYTKLWGILQS
jgi:hypothetical protein